MTEWQLKTKMNLIRQKQIKYAEADLKEKNVFEGISKIKRYFYKENKNI